MSVAALAPEDVEAVVGLWERCALVRPWNDARTEFIRALAGPASTVLGRREGAEVVSTALVGEDGRRGWIYYVAVTPARRGEGLGREVIGAAESWLRGRGLAKSMLMVRADNAAVLDFYRGLGYEVESTALLSHWLEGG